MSSAVKSAIVIVGLVLVIVLGFYALNQLSLEGFTTCPPGTATFTYTRPAQNTDSQVTINEFPISYDNFVEFNDSNINSFNSSSSIIFNLLLSNKYYSIFSYRTNL
jgi:hypothetical protein